MAIILNIDTAVDTASVCLAADGMPLAYLENERRADHASWLQPAIQDLFKTAGISVEQTDAIAVSNGPGSYTGLRVGLSAAKGLCYALNKSLITVSTLELMAHAVKDHPGMLRCPMIDARRMEVYTALYAPDGRVVLPPQAMILELQSFATSLEANHILFFGNGSEKFKTICTHANASFAVVQSNAVGLASFSHHLYLSGSFADTAYSEPFYCKEFHTGVKN